MNCRFCSGHIVGLGGCGVYACGMSRGTGHRVCSFVCRSVWSACGLAWLIGERAGNELGLCQLRCAAAQLAAVCLFVSSFRISASTPFAVMPYTVDMFYIRRCGRVARAS